MKKRTLMFKLVVQVVLLGCVVAVPYNVAVGESTRSEERCLNGTDCYNSNNLSIINGMRYCCPNGNGMISTSMTSINGETNFTCKCSSGTTMMMGRPMQFDWQMFNHQMRGMLQQMANIFYTPFRGGWWK